MGVVVKFPTRSGDVPLLVVSETLGRLVGKQTDDWHSVENNTYWLMDRAGFAVLSIEKEFCNAMRVTLRMWDEARGDYEEHFRCIVMLSNETVENVLDSKGAALSFDARRELRDILDNAELALSLGSVTRIVN